VKIDFLEFQNLKRASFFSVQRGLQNLNPVLSMVLCEIGQICGSVAEIERAYSIQQFHFAVYEFSSVTEIVLFLLNYVFCTLCYSNIHDIIISRFHLICERNGMLYVFLSTV